MRAQLEQNVFPSGRRNELQTDRHVVEKSARKYERRHSSHVLRSIEPDHRLQNAVFMCAPHHGFLADSGRQCRQCWRDYAVDLFERAVELFDALEPGALGFYEIYRA